MDLISTLLISEVTIHYPQVWLYNYGTSQDSNDGY